MKIIRNKKELLKFVEGEDDAYDVDSRDHPGLINYEYPILIDCLGWNNLGLAYKVYIKEDIDELTKFMEEISSKRLQ